MKLKDVRSESLNEAKFISYDKLPKVDQIKVSAFSKILKGKRLDVFEGINGKIVVFEVDNQHKRIFETQLKQLMKFQMRWIESTNDKMISIGF